MRSRTAKIRAAVAMASVVIASLSLWVGLAGAHGSKRVADTVSVTLTPPKHFSGVVGAFHLGRANLGAICAPGRKVLLNFRNAPDQSVTLEGTDRTDAGGNWQVDASKTLHGQVQAVVKRRNVFKNGTRYICRSAHTAFQDV